MKIEFKRAFTVVEVDGNLIPMEWISEKAAWCCRETREEVFAWPEMEIQDIPTNQPWNWRPSR